MVRSSANSEIQITADQSTVTMYGAAMISAPFARCLARSRFGRRRNENAARAMMAMPKR